jgi:hypothetical protein
MIILYSTGCPKCNVLEKKLKSKNVEYVLVEGEQAISEKGFSEAPLLEVEGSVKTFPEAVQWVNNL